jgi:RecB family exonuclease
MPNPISVSELQSAVLCRARYFFRHILGLQALDVSEPGIPAQERGKIIHAILASFVSLAARIPEGPDRQPDALADLLKKTIAGVIGARLSQAVWQVELDRLTGKPGCPGLLEKWLDLEQKRMLDGWSWAAVERQFESLEIEGCPIRLKGRLDRIDAHPQLGLVCWDYKTGRLPLRTEIVDNHREPQLPAYLTALSRGNVTSAPKTGSGCGAGFVELASPGKLKHHVVFDPSEVHRPFLEEWQKTVSSVLNSISSGNISPLWLTEGRPCEENCEYTGICGSPLNKESSL